MVRPRDEPDKRRGAIVLRSRSVRLFWLIVIFILSTVGLFTVGRHSRPVRPLPRLFWLIIVLVFSAIGLVLAGYHSAHAISVGDPGEIKRIFVGEGSGTIATCALVPAIVLVFRRVMPKPNRLPRGIVIHVFGLLAYSTAHTMLLALLHRFFFPLFGVVPDSFLPQLTARAAQELCHDAIAYVLCVVIVTMWNFAITLRERELRAAQLESALVDSQLLCLRAQLQPQFLFNTLNTIAASLHDNPRAADRMITHLAKLLRASLHKSSNHEVPLRQELETLADYTALLEARFGHRLQVQTDIEPDAEQARVPSLLLQALVEHVLRHGVEASSQPLRVDLCARVRAGELAIDIEDNGPGLNGRKDRLRSAIGLSSSVERLRLLYGERARLDARDRVDGRLCVQLRLPFHISG
jgi:hypothetical protein